MVGARWVAPTHAERDEGAGTRDEDAERGAHGAGASVPGGMHVGDRTVDVEVTSVDLFDCRIFFDSSRRRHTRYQLRENEEKFKLTDMMEFHFIEMSKLIREWKAGKLDPWNDALARWLLMLGMVDRRHGTVYKDIYKELEEIAMKDETLKEAF